MKKTGIVLQCVALAAAIIFYFLFQAYSHLQSDTQGPEIEIDNEILEISVEDPREALLEGITAYDKRDHDVTDSIVVESITGINEEHTVMVTYAAFDESGNVTKARREVRYTDYVSPRFTLSSPLCFSSDSKQDMMHFVGAWDVVDGDITRRVRATLISDTGSLREAGIHTVQLAVRNSLGDMQVIQVPVEVYEPGKYNAQLALSQNIVYLPKGSQFNPKNYLMTYTYQNNQVPLNQSVPSELSLKIDNTVQTDTPGVYAVTYTVTYMPRDTAYVARSCLIVIIEE